MNFTLFSTSYKYSTKSPCIQSGNAISEEVCSKNVKFFYRDATGCRWPRAQTVILWGSSSGGSEGDPFEFLVQ